MYLSNIYKFIGHVTNIFFFILIDYKKYEKREFHNKITGIIIYILRTLLKSLDRLTISTLLSHSVMYYGLSVSRNEFKTKSYQYELKGFFTSKLVFT